MMKNPSEVEPRVRPWHSIGVKLVAGLLILTLAAGAGVWMIATAEQVGAARIAVFTGEGRIVAASDLAAIGASIQTAANSECPRCDSTRAEDFAAAATRWRRL